MEKTSFFLPTNYIYVVERLSDHQAGELIKMILEYVCGENPDITRHGIQVEFAFLIAKPWIDQRAPDYREDGKNRHSKIRYNRIQYSRSMGTHSKDEWAQMKDFFLNKCCRCQGNSGITSVAKDHVISVYSGGSDSIRNLQPLCYKCNSSKGRKTEDYRPMMAHLIGKDLPELYKNPY